MTPLVTLLAAGAARDERLVAAITDLVNDAYAAGEVGLWLPGWTRTTGAQIRSLIGDGGMVVATAGERIVGCAHVRQLDPGTADLGFISAAPDRWGGGAGRALVPFAEDPMRSRGVRTMQLELLVPRNRTHPAKERLRAWYERLGYEPARRAPFDEVSTHAASQLATPCEFLVFRKALDGTA